MQPYYTVQAGDTWASIAQKIYGTSAVASELQAALGSPALTAGAALVGLPADLTYTTTASGAAGLNNSPGLTPTQTQTQSNSAALNSADLLTTQTQVQSESATLNSTGLPTTKLETLTVTAELTLLLQNDTTSISTAPPSSYTVQSGDTWASIVQRIYQTTDPNAGPALQAAMGSPALTPGSVLTNFPTQISFRTTNPPQIYTVQPSDTWASITQYLYSSSAPNAITALQNALGTQTLTPGVTLNLPATISYLATVNVTVAPYYTTQAGDTWASITQRFYGTSDPNAAAALQAAFGGFASPGSGGQLTLPTTLTWSSPVSVTVFAYYVVQSGDTWAWIAGKLYNSRALGSALQNALGNPTLTAGAHLTNLSSSLSETLTTTSVIPPNYTVGQGATWASVTAAIYGTSDPHAVAALQAALGNPTLTAGEQLALPSSLTFQPSTALALHPYYTVQAGDTWASITQAIYGSSDPDAAMALQAALGGSGAHGGCATGRAPSQPPGCRHSPSGRLHARR